MCTLPYRLSSAQDQPGLKQGASMLQACPSDRRPCPAVLMDPGFGTYLRDYTDSPAEGVSDREPRKVPFLRRLLSSRPSSRGLSNGNMSLSGSGSGSGTSHKAGGDADADAGLIDALRGSLVVNGLECKLSCSSSKVRSLSGPQVVGRCCGVSRRPLHVE